MRDVGLLFDCYLELPHMADEKTNAVDETPVVPENNAAATTRIADPGGFLRRFSAPRPAIEGRAT